MSLGQFVQFGSFAKVVTNDDGTIELHGIASTPNRDDADEIITADAMREALPDYRKWGAVREMHGSSAAGTAMSIDVDENGVTNIVAHIVDPLAVKKIQTGVYKGFSVGGKVLARDPADRRMITKIKLVEVSVVDRPCNPEAQFNMWKAETADTLENEMTVETPAPVFAPPAADVRARATEMAKTAGKPAKRYVDYLFKAREALKEEFEAELLKAADAALEPVVDDEPVVETVETVVEETMVEEMVVEKALTPAELLAAQLASVEAALATPGGIRAVEVASTPFDPIEMFGKAAEAQAERLEAEGVMAKGLRGISSLACAIYNLVAVHATVATEAASEGDNSPVPGQIAAGIETLLNALSEMAREEVSELMADLNGDSGMVEEAVDYWASAEAVDVIKAALAKRSEVVDEPTEEVAKASVLEADNEALNKALSDTATRIAGISDTIEALKKSHADQIEELTKKLEAFGKEPLPPKTMGVNTVLAPSKEEEFAGEPVAKAVTSDDFNKYLASLSEEERGLALIKISRMSPREYRA